MIGANTLRLLLAAAALCSAGCATTPASEVRQPFLPYQLAPVQREPTRTPVARQRSTDLELGKPTSTGPAIRIDADLVRFAVAQRAARERVASGAPMPADIIEGWSLLLGAVDRYLAQHPGTATPLDVIRARVTLDAELDLDGGHYGLLPTGLPTAVKARTRQLETRLGEVRRFARPARRAPSRITWPISPVVVTSLYGHRDDPFSGEERFHSGVDLKARTGQLIQAAGDGTVTRAGWNGGHGLHAEVVHDDGTITRYSHLSTVLVAVGMRVPAGAPLGLAGSTGRSTGPHLHFELVRDGQPLDPLDELIDPAQQEPSLAIGGD